MKMSAREFRKSIMLLLKVVIFAALVGSFTFIWINFYEEAAFVRKGNYLTILLYAALLLVFSYIYGSFKIGASRLGEVTYSLSLAIVFTNVITYIQLSLVASALLEISIILALTFIQIFIAIVFCYFANMIYFILYPSRQIIAVYSDVQTSKEFMRKISKVHEKYVLKSAIHSETPYDEIIAEIDKYYCVLICDVNPELRDRLITYCCEKEKRVYILPSITDIMINNALTTQVFDTPMFLSKNKGLSVEQLIIKRTIDIILSVLAAIIFSPALIVIPICIKLCDRGPVFFRQERVTKDNKIFSVVKFRSMRVDAEKDGAQKAVDNDDRITSVGKVIRFLRLDELPQIINILQGDMSIVGPRPERIENVEEYTGLIPEFPLRHKVKAGLTGYAQVYGKYNTSPKDKLAMDLLYIQKYSVLSDLKLIFLTVKILFLSESTEGFEDKKNDK